MNYFLRGNVRGVHFFPTSIIASVVGSEVYEVSLDWTSIDEIGDLHTECGCVFFQEGNYCKHLWALILALDRRGDSKIIPVQKIYDLEMMGTAAESDTDTEWGPALKQLPLGNGTSPHLTVVKPAKQKDWRSSFMVTASNKLQPVKKSEEEPFYFLTITESAQYEHVNLTVFNRASIHDGQSPQPLKLPETGKLALGDPALEAILHAVTLLSRAQQQSSPFSYRNFERSVSFYTYTVLTESLRPMLKTLLDTGKIFSAPSGGVGSALACASRSLASAKIGTLGLIVTETESGFSLSGQLQVLPDTADALVAQANPETSSNLVSVGDIKQISEPNLFLAGRWLGFIDLTEYEKIWFDDLRSGPILVPTDDTEPFLEAVLNQPLQVSLPEKLNWKRVSLFPKAVINLKTERQDSLGRLRFELKFQYGPRSVSYLDPNKYLASFEELTIYEREKANEDLIYSRVPMELLEPGRSENAGDLFVRPNNLASFVRTVLEAGIPVFVDSRNVQAETNFEFSVSSGLDWFDVNCEVEFNGRWVKVPAILEATAKGEAFVPTGDGTLGLIDPKLMERIQRLGKFSEPVDDGMRFTRSQGLLLNSMLENEEKLKTDATFRKLREKIRSFSGIKSVKPPVTFTGKLRKYQTEGLAWLEFLESFGLGGILADDMGLGKTVQCLAFLESRRIRRKGRGSPNLLLAPKSLLPNWQTEAGRFVPGMKVLIHAGLEREDTASDFRNYDLVVSTYHTMVRDFDLMKRVDWNSVILDEAQNIKNPQSLMSKAVKQLPAKFRLAMTGTPIENSIQDLFSISDFVNPGFLFGSKRVAGNHSTVTDDVQSLLSKAFKPVILRRTKNQVLKDLPEKIEQTVTVELEPKQLKVYNELKRFYQSQLLKTVQERGVKKSQIQILAALTRLRQAALHPGLISDSHRKTKSAKFEALFEILNDVIAEGHRVLIFSQFTSLLALLKIELQSRKIQYSYLDGQTTKRQDVIDSFKASSNPVFLMSLKAGGVGLNLVEANYVFLLDPWWNPATEAQAIDRAHRLGQKRAVNAYRFIAKDTVEEKILQLQKQKKEISDEILTGKSNLIRSLTAQDFELLLS